jgi:hypothetical protein
LIPCSDELGHSSAKANVLFSRVEIGFPDCCVKAGHQLKVFHLEHFAT